ncbi:MAG: AMP-binding protein, partial [Paracoccaceae bacterium]
MRTSHTRSVIENAARTLPQQIISAAIVRRDTILSIDRTAQARLRIFNVDAPTPEAQNDFMAQWTDEARHQTRPQDGPLWHLDILSNVGHPFALCLSADEAHIGRGALHLMAQHLEAILHNSEVDPASDPTEAILATRALAPFQTANPLPFAQEINTRPKTISLDLPEHFESLQRHNPDSAQLCAHMAWGLTLARLSHLPYAVFGSYDTMLTDDAPAPYCIEAREGMCIDDLGQSLRTQMTLLRHCNTLALADMRHLLGVPDDVSLFKTTLSTTMPLSRANAPDEDCAIFVAQTSIQAQFSPRFTANSARRILLYFSNCLEAMIKQSGDQPLHTVTMLSRPERARCLRTGACETTERTDLDMVHILEHQSERTPLAAALSKMGSSHDPISYQDVSRQSNTVAHALIAQGVRAGDVVAICLERSPEFIIALYGVLKAGCVCVPIDPAEPPATKEYMQIDSGAKCVITNSRLETAPNVPRLEITELMAQNKSTGAPTVAPPCPTDPDRVAYIIYEGSLAGKLKGVVTTHRAAVAHALAILSPYNFAQSHPVLQCASMSSDILISEMLGASLSGAQLVLRDDRFLTDVAYCIDALAQHTIAIAMLPPDFWSALTDELHRGNLHLPDTLKTVIVSGAQAMPQTLDKWRQVAKDIRWIHAYGPTETAVCATTYTLDERWNPDQNVPIGRPLEQGNAHILCYDGSLAPIGVNGFLWISGVCVAKGYHNNPDLSLEKFHDTP